MEQPAQGQLLVKLTLVVCSRAYNRKDRCVIRAKKLAGGLDDA